MKLAIITSHPIQYYAPWFRILQQNTGLSIKVFYLWDFGVTQQIDRQFSQSFQWDIPLLDGYEFEWVENSSSEPGTHHFLGLQNPSLSRQVNAYRPDAVLMMSYNYISLYRFIFSWNRCPILFRGDSHRLCKSQGLKQQLKQRWIRQIYRRFAAVLYVGQHNYRYFREHGVSASRLFYTPHAVDNDRFFQYHPQAHQGAENWKKSLGIPTQNRVILFAGKFIHKKRPLDLLAAFERANLTDASLVFVGAGPLEAELRQRAEHVSEVYFAPFQNQSQMPRTYAAADLFVLPSYGSGETWGLAVNEAMAMGKAIIVSDHVGCSADLVVPGENGWVFQAGDRQDLQQALERAWADPAQLQRWGQASQRRIRSFSYAQMTQGLNRALQSLSL